MNMKKYPVHFVLKGDTEENWLKVADFVPLDKELIEYKPDKVHPVARLKIGDGVTKLADLPFITDVEDLASKEWVQEQAGALGLSVREYIDNAIQGLASEKYVDGKIAAIEFPEVDQTYSAVSENAQSGKSIAEALRSIEIPEVDKNYNANSENAVSGVAVAEALCNATKTTTKDNILSIFN